MSAVGVVKIPASEVRAGDVVQLHAATGRMVIVEVRCIGTATNGVMLDGTDDRGRDVSWHVSMWDDVALIDWREEVAS
jgi:hypothetical protein